jgi:hypothetical protein
LAGIIILTFIINSHMNESEKEIPFPKIMCGIPTYQDAWISSSMSSLNSDPFIAVFFTRDSYKQVLHFYQDRLNMDYKVLKYGKGKKVTKTIYQFEIKKGVLKDYISKGVEITPLNTRSQRIYKAKTKIRIIIPKIELKAASTKKKIDN